MHNDVHSHAKTSLAGQTLNLMDQLDITVTIITIIILGDISMRVRIGYTAVLYTYVCE
jgi:hypothetical protein